MTEELVEKRTDLRAGMHGLFSIILPIAVLAFVISSFISSYNKWGWMGFLGNSVLMIIFAGCGIVYTEKDEVDNDENEG